MLRIMEGGFHRMTLIAFLDLMSERKGKPKLDLD
jgi:hypothetical protein